MTKQPCDRACCYRYAIRIEGHLDSRWSDWFDGMTITPQPQGDTIIEGPMVDQSSLQGLLAKIRNLNLSLVSVQRRVPDSAASSDREARGQDDA